MPPEEKLAATTPPFSGEIKNKLRYFFTPPFGSITSIGTTLPYLYQDIIKHFSYYKFYLL